MVRRLVREYACLLYCCTFILGCWPCSPLYANETDQLMHGLTKSVHELIQATLLYHPKMLSAKEKYKAAKQRLYQSGGIYDPTLVGKWQYIPDGKYQYDAGEIALQQFTPLWGARLVGLYRRSGGNIPIYKYDARTTDLGELRASVEIPVWKGGPIDPPRANLRLAEYEAYITYQELKQTALAMWLAMLERYWRLLAAYDILAVEEDLLSKANIRTDGIDAGVLHGDLPAIEAIENQRAVLLRQERKLLADRDVQLQQLQLAEISRTEAGEPRLLSLSEQVQEWPDLVDPKLLHIETQLNDYTAYACAQRPDIEILTTRWKIANVRVQLHQNQLAPDIFLSGMVARDLKNAEETPARWQMGIQLALPLTLREARGRYASAVASLAAAHQELVVERQQVQLSLQAIFRTWLAAFQRALIVEQEVEVARKVEAGELERFHLGDSTLLITNLREQATADAQKRLIAARLDVVVAMAKWVVALADVPVGEWLDH